jgi:predicted dehydrogenase
MSAVAGSARVQERPRIGFLGVGWIGRHRMGAIIKSGAAEVAGIADASPEATAEASRLAPDAELVRDLDELLDLELDGVVIATPSALHAEQAMRALAYGTSVFCQKPLGRTAAEVENAVEAARTADRLLGLDLSYRFTEGMQRIRELIRSGGLGGVFAVDLLFHNAYGPDKPWFYDPALSGGGCVMDLGVHLVDLALWTLDAHCRDGVRAKLFAHGQPLADAAHQVEDYASVQFELDNGAAVSLACSWRLQAGCDAIIGAAFYGTQGGAALRNVDGSFYDFIAEHYRGTARERLASPPDAWGGRAAVDWVMRLHDSGRFSPEALQFIEVARVIDRIYGR